MKLQAAMAVHEEAERSGARSCWPRGRGRPSAVRGAGVVGNDLKRGRLEAKEGCCACRQPWPKRSEHATARAARGKLAAGSGGWQRVSSGRGRRLRWLVTSGTAAEVARAWSCRRRSLTKQVLVFNFKKEVETELEN